MSTTCWSASAWSAFVIEQLNSDSSEGDVGSWGFIGLAYGVASVALLGYLILLKGRLRGAWDELAALERDGRRRTG